MIRNKRNNLIAVLLALLMVIAMMPVATQEVCAAEKTVDFTKYIQGLLNGKFVVGSTVTFDVNEIIESDSEMKAQYLKYGAPDVLTIVRSEHSSGEIVFTDKKASGKVDSSPLSKDADTDFLVKIGISFEAYGGDVFYSPEIDTIGRQTNTLAVKGKTVTVKYKKLKKKTQYLKVSKVIKFINKGQGHKEYKLYTAKKGKKSYKKYFKVSPDNGKVTVKKGLKKGTYKLRVRVQAIGDNWYNMSNRKVVTIRIKVK